jgi:hypothetical protein
MRIVKFTLFFLTLACSIHAQQTCAFQKLFTFKPGMSKMVVLDSVNKTYQLAIADTKTQKLPPYKNSGGDSIVNEIISYKIDNSPCFRGTNTKLFLEFADNKLYKAYIVTEYSKTAYQDMISNFNTLRSSIKPYWKYEKEVKISGDNFLGFGYDYTKQKNATLKTEKVSLQYVDVQTNNSATTYQLELLWANLENTRMEGSNY